MRCSLSMLIDVTLVAMVGACATPARHLDFGKPSSPPSACSILGTELRSASLPYLYEALASVRPTMLHAHGRPSVPAIVLDGVLTAHPDLLLRSIPVSEVRSVRRLSPSEAGGRYGTAVNGAAVLEIVTMRSSTDSGGEHIQDCS